MVLAVIEEGDLTPEQEKSLERLTTFLETLTEELGKVGQSERAMGVEAEASPTGAAKRLARMIIKSEQA